METSTKSLNNDSMKNIQHDIDLAQTRFCRELKRLKINKPDQFFEDILETLCFSPVWFWQFLMGFDKTLKALEAQPQGRRELLLKLSQDRIKRIVGDYFKVAQYVERL